VTRGWEVHERSERQSENMGGFWEENSHEGWPVSSAVQPAASPVTMRDSISYHVEDEWRICTVLGGSGREGPVCV
jgi:hypothetical protein